MYLIILIHFQTDYTCFSENVFILSQAHQLSEHQKPSVSLFKFCFETYLRLRIILEEAPSDDEGRRKRNLFLTPPILKHLMNPLADIQ